MAESSRREFQEVHQELERFLDLPRPDVRQPEARDWALQLRDRLSDLHEKVRQNHRAKQDAEVFRKLSERYPRAADKFERLHDEHETICEDLETIITASERYSSASPPSDPRLRRRARGVLETISRHESEETTLVQDLVSTDVGTGD